MAKKTLKAAKGGEERKAVPISWTVPGLGISGEFDLADSLEANDPHYLGEMLKDFEANTLPQGFIGDYMNSILEEDVYEAAAEQIEVTIDVDDFRAFVRKAQDES